MSIDTTNEQRKKLPNTEQMFLDFLNGMKVDGAMQVEIDDCPFTVYWKHKVDFAIRNVNGEELYVEVKGWMSYSSVNELQYLLRYSGHKFYILQVTNEDWMGLYEKGKQGNVTKKIDANREAQYEEIKDFINGKKTAQAMADISMRRLEEFVKVRKGDLERWKQRLREKKASKRRTTANG